MGPIGRYAPVTLTSREGSAPVRSAIWTCLLPLLVTLSGCEEPAPPPWLAMIGGDPASGRRLIADYGCGACHMVDGVRGARGMVGPPLRDLAQRTTLAGQIPNTPANMLQWLLDPPSLVPSTAMPAVGLTLAEARDIGAFLYSQGAEAARVHPPEAQRLPVRPELLAQVRARDQARLESLESVGPDHLRIPIDRAIELLAEGAD
jgi:cytochrome c2